MPKVQTPNQASNDQRLRVCTSTLIPVVLLNVFVFYLNDSPSSWIWLVPSAFGIGTMVGILIEPLATPTKISFLLRPFLSPNNLEGIVGDLDERFLIAVQQKGRRTAVHWLYREVAHSFFSLALDALKRISGLEKLLRRIGS